MSRPQRWVLGLAALLAGAYPAAGAGPPRPADARREARALTARIDELLARRWAAAKVGPAAPAEDGEFLRRVYLDLAGRVPSVTEARQFLDDRRPDKRQRLVEKLLAGPRYVTHFTNVWRGLLLPETATSLQARVLAPGFEAWLRRQIARNVGYDRMVRDLLTAPVRADTLPGVLGRGARAEPSPLAFYLAKEVKPENLAASTARLFLGVRLECAQCHNHPFARWKRQQFWGYAALFAGVQGRQQGQFFVPLPERRDRRQLRLPGTGKVVRARFLDGKEPRWGEGVGGRDLLAGWMTAPDNPYFARAAVNRLWAYFFGTGLVDPVDEMVGADSTCSHPELLDELARQFAAHQFDVKFLIRAITASRAYQLSSVATRKGQEDPALFARMAIRGLSAEQLFDSIAQAVGYHEAASGGPRAALLGGDPVRAAFLGKFANQDERPTETQTSVIQALTLMNGSVVAAATSLGRSETLAAVVDAPFLTTARRVETLYLATLSRRPRDKELARLVKYVDGGGAGEDGDKDRRYAEALADVFWVLLNSGEFFLNH